MFIGMSTGLVEKRGDYSPSLSLDFLTGLTDSRITYSGGTNGTRINSAGVLVAATTPRIDFDPVTLACRGLLVEEARTNLLLNSLLNGANLSTQSVTLTAVSHTLSFYGTGTVTLSGASTAGPLVGSDAYPTRSTLTFTPTVGSVTFTVTGTVQFAQLELAAFATSFIPTAGASATRAADNGVMTGTNFSDWYNQTEGTFVAEWLLGDDVISTAIYQADDGTSTNLIRLRYGAAGTVNDTAVILAGTAVAQLITSAQQTPDTTYRSAMAYKLNDFARSVDGAAVITDTLGGIPTVTQLGIGRNNVGGEQPNCHIRSIRYYRTRLSDAQLQALSA